ncbi:OmpA family protein [Pseudoalteromonas sp. T1lg48]|uniref:OmpA family protein n=1 Tax=Pseudoalteromonas sp. T1lg48 TaxID=2077100 RepID=UPI00131A253A|nr:OmpA family protein [Pseudoalteromonas sp. T1lg48]
MKSNLVFFTLAVTSIAVAKVAEASPHCQTSHSWQCQQNHGQTNQNPPNSGNNAGTTPNPDPVNPTLGSTTSEHNVDVTPVITHPLAVKKKYHKGPNASGPGQKATLKPRPSTTATYNSKTKPTPSQLAEPELTQVAVPTPMEQKTPTPASTGSSTGYPEPNKVDVPVPTPIEQKTPTPTSTGYPEPNKADVPVPTPIEQKTPTPTSTGYPEPNKADVPVPTPIEQKTPTPTSTGYPEPNKADVAVPTPIEQKTPTPTSTGVSTGYPVPNKVDVAVPSPLKQKVPRPVLTPELIATPGKTPIAVPMKRPIAVPPKTPQIVTAPAMVPIKVPTAVPLAVPQAVPTATPYQGPVAVTALTQPILQIGAPDKLNVGTTTHLLTAQPQTGLTRVDIYSTDGIEFATHEELNSLEYDGFHFAVVGLNVPNVEYNFIERPKAEPGTFVFYFDFASSLIHKEQQGMFDEIVAKYQHRAAPITVIGETDGFGSEQYNTALAHHRSAIIVQELIARGVDESHIELNLAIRCCKAEAPTVEAIEATREQRITWVHFE